LFTYLLIVCVNGTVVLAVDSTEKGVCCSSERTVTELTAASGESRSEIHLTSPMSTELVKFSEILSSCSSLCMDLF